MTRLNDDIGHNPSTAKLNHEGSLSPENFAASKIFRKILLHAELSLLNSRQSRLFMGGWVYPIQTSAT